MAGLEVGVYAGAGTSLWVGLVAGAAGLVGLGFWVGGCWMDGVDTLRDELSCMGLVMDPPPSWVGLWLQSGNQSGPRHAPASYFL